VKKTLTRLLFILIISFLLLACNNYFDGSGSDNTISGISYDANGADSGSIPASHAATINIQNNIGDLEKNGYVFDGWNSKSDGSGRNYYPGSYYSGKGLVLYAKWAAVFQYRISGSLSSSQKSSGASQAAAQTSYLHLTGVTNRGSQLTKLDITETIDGYSVTSIDNGAFRSCTKVKSVTIPKTMKRIGDNAFAGCSSLEKVVLEGTVPPEMGTGVLDSCSAVICVPPEAVSNYSNSAGWSSYTEKVVSYYTVTFDSQGATVVASPKSVEVVSTANTVSDMPSSPSRDGYLFGGWYTRPDGGGSLFTAATPVSGNITVYAKWTAIKSSGVHLTFNVKSFKDARVPSHVFDNTTPDAGAQYYYKATPAWTSNISSVAGATDDFVPLPYAYSITTKSIDVGYFAAGTWNFTVQVISTRGAVIYEKTVNSCTVAKSLSSVDFALEKIYSSTGTLDIEADVADPGSSSQLFITYVGAKSGQLTVLPDTATGAGHTFKAQVSSLTPGFYWITLSYQEEGVTKGSKSGYIELFGDEVSLLSATVEKGKWISESYSNAGISAQYPFEAHNRLGIIVTGTPAVTDKCWTFTAVPTSDSEKIGTYVWYVNGFRKSSSGSSFTLEGMSSGKYYVQCFALDTTKNYGVTAGVSLSIY